MNAKVFKYADDGQTIVAPYKGIETKRKRSGKRMLKIVVPGGMWHTQDMIAIFLNNVPLVFGSVNYKVLYSSKQTNIFLIAEL